MFRYGRSSLHGWELRQRPSRSVAPIIPYVFLPRVSRVPQLRGGLDTCDASVKEVEAVKYTVRFWLKAATGLVTTPSYGFLAVA